MNARFESRLNSEAEYKKLIGSVDLFLASIAWKHYQLEGRGALYIDLGLAEDIGGDRCLMNVRYVTAGDEAGIDPELHPDTRQALSQYDPEREFVAWLFLPDEQFAVYIIECKVPLAEAYLMQAAKELPISLNN